MADRKCSSTLVVISSKLLSHSYTYIHTAVVPMDIVVEIGKSEKMF